MNIPEVLSAFKLLLEPLGVDVYDYFPDAPNVPCIIVLFESVPFDTTQDGTYLIRLIYGTTEMQGAQAQLFTWLGDGDNSVVGLIDADNTLGGVVSSVVPLEVRDWGVAPVLEGRTRLLQADIVCGVLT